MKLDAKTNKSRNSDWKSSICTSRYGVPRFAKIRDPFGTWAPLKLRTSQITRKFKSCACWIMRQIQLRIFSINAPFQIENCYSRAMFCLIWNHRTREGKIGVLSKNLLQSINLTVRSIKRESYVPSDIVKFVHVNNSDVTMSYWLIMVVFNLH